MTASQVHEYERIAANLRKRIDDGVLSDRLPTEKELAAEYGVSLATMRSALSVLLGEGRITRRQKVGTFVTPRGKFLRDGPGRLRPGPRRFISADIDGRALEVTGFRSGVRTARVDESFVVRCFGLSTPLIWRERVYLAGGEPVQLATNFLPQWLFPDGGEGVLLKDVQGGIWGFLERLGHTLSEGEEVLEFRSANKKESRLLKLASGSWVVLIYRPVQDVSGQLVDLAVITLPAARWMLRYPLKLI